MQKVQIKFCYSQPRTSQTTHRNLQQPINPSILNKKKNINLVSPYMHNLTPPRCSSPKKMQRPCSLHSELPLQSNHKNKASLSRVKSSNLSDKVQAPPNEAQDELSHRSNSYQQIDAPQNQQMLQDSEYDSDKSPIEDEPKAKLTKSQIKRILNQKYKYSGINDYASKKQNWFEEKGICGCCDWRNKVRAPIYQIED